MAIISNSTFDPFRQFVAVRLQQGVPIVDADWNELDDIRSFEVRAFLKWFVGDGVPEGNHGFKIVGEKLENDFSIASGTTGTPDGLNNVGRCLVNGMDVLIKADIKFSEQTWSETKNPSPSLLAQTLGGGKITGLKKPEKDGIAYVYLDVWERFVSPSDDDTLILPGLGTESCARIKREWAVRVADITHPIPTKVPGHSYYHLAAITRRAGDPVVYPEDIQDHREQRLLLPPATLIEDTLGIDPIGYRRGQGRPIISLRETINTLLRGGFPRTPDTPLTTLLPFMDWNGFLFDHNHGLVALWTSPHFGNKSPIVASWLNLQNISEGFAAPLQITSDASYAHGYPSAALLPNGDLLVTYLKVDGTSANKRAIFYKHASLEGLNIASEQAVTPTGDMGQYYGPSVIVTGDLVTFFYLDASTKVWQYRRLQLTQLTTNTFLDTESRPFPGVVDGSLTFHAAPGKNGDIWIAITTHEDDHYKVVALQFTPSTDNISNVKTLMESIQGLPPFVLCRSNGDVQVFWNQFGKEDDTEKSEVYCTTYRNGSWQSAQSIPKTANAKILCAVEDAHGTIWLFWACEKDEESNIFFMSYDPITNECGQPRQMSFPPNGQRDGLFLLSALIAPDNTTWVFWTRSRSTAAGIRSTLYYTRLITSL